MKIMPYVLVVEDNPDWREALCAYLEKSGYEVAGESNGHRAVSSILERIPDLIALDLYMPQMDGSQFLEVIRSYVRLHKLPVVVLTAYMDSPLVERVRGLNVNAILAKHKTTFKDLDMTIKGALRGPPA